MTPAVPIDVDTPGDVGRIVGRARAALPGWRDAAPHARAAVLRRAAAELRARVDELGLLHARESGKVLAQAHHEIAGAANQLDANAELGRLAAGTLAPTGALPGGERDLTLVERVPLGVVVCVIPFNFPVELTVEKAGAALAAGNVVVVKPPPQNPQATLAVVDILQRAGLPDGVLQAAPGDTAFSAALCAADGVDAVSLTGSVAAGVAVARATAHRLRPLHLELGGNGAAVVLPDADLDLVVSETLRGRLLMNGQACAATKRLVVVGADRHDAVVERLRAALAEVQVGDPCDPSSRLGPLIDDDAATRVEAQVARAVAQGATLAHGDGRADGPWFAPTLLARVGAEADVAVDDEIFGPVFTVIPVADAETAVVVANATSLRLTAAVFGRDVAGAIAVAQQLDFGGVVVNGTNNYRPPVVPFGGVGLAGAGREGAGYTFEELTRTRFLALRHLRPPARPLAPAPTATAPAPTFFEDPAPIPGAGSSKTQDESAREEVAATARRLVAAGLVEGFGHVSARRGDGFVITGTRPLAPATAGEVIVVDGQGRPVAGPVDTLPLEAPLHAAIYRARPDVGAICRGHPPAAVTWGTTVRPLPLLHGLGALAGLHIGVHPDVRLVSNADRAAAAAATLGTDLALLLRGNGALAVGAELDEAAVRLWFLEERARVAAGPFDDSDTPVDPATWDERSGDSAAELRRAVAWFRSTFDRPAPGEHA